MYVVGCYEMFWVGCMWLIVMKCLYNVVYVGGCEGSGFRVERWARPILTVIYTCIYIYIYSYMQYHMQYHMQYMNYLRPVPGPCQDSFLPKAPDVSDQEVWQIAS